MECHLLIFVGLQFVVMVTSSLEHEAIGFHSDRIAVVLPDNRVFETFSNCLHGNVSATGECRGECRKGTFGNYCERYCIEMGTCYTSCDKLTGNCHCPSQCAECMSPGLCTKCEDPTKYGSQCDQSCSSTCKFNRCSVTTGVCLDGCQTGYWGRYCNSTCPVSCDGTCEQFSGKCLLCRHCVSNCSADSGECGGGCEKGFYGPFCNKFCVNCLNSCDKITGQCDCPPQCLECNSDGKCSACVDRTVYGESCDKQCPRNCLYGRCSIGSGICNEGCMPGFWGEFCNTTCSHDCRNECNRYTGKCMPCTGCLSGCSAATGECSGLCEKGLFGRNCENYCVDSGVCYSGCNKTTGACDCPRTCRECGSNDDCYSCVDSTKYGSTCQLSCQTNCKNGECALIDGSCLTGCETGYWGAQCDQICPIGCENECDRTSGACLLCSNCLEGCSSESGECLGSCEKGSYGKYCENMCIDKSLCYSGCDKITGNCTCQPECLQCESYDQCSVCVDKTKYGPKCDMLCPSNCRDGVCAITSGKCLTGCVSGYWGQFCNNTCSGKCDRECNQYSGECLHCGKCLLGCSTLTGECFGTCEKGTFGRFCERFCIDSGECYSGCNKTTGACDCPESCRECGSPNDCYTCVDSTNYGSTCQLSCPRNCKGGECSSRDGSCLTGCKTGYWGAQCDKICPIGCENECDRTSGACLPCSNCLEGCSSESGECLGSCEKGSYGKYCENMCIDKSMCYSGCDKITGNCTCRPNCLQCECYDQCSVCVDKTKYGPKCDMLCPSNCQDGVCAITSGKCLTGCVSGYWGQFCNNTCSGKCDRECNQYSGECLHCGKCLWGCSASTGECFGTCEKGTFGRFCEYYCIDSGVCYSGCNKTTGACDCPESCQECGSYNDCYSCVDSIKYGRTCQLSCPQNCKGGECVPRDGSCLTGCETGYWGAQCDKICPMACENECDRTSGTCLPCSNCFEGCSSESGECLGSCEKGSYGKYCENMCIDKSVCYSGCDKITGNCTCRPNCLQCESYDQCSVCVDKTKYGPKCDMLCPSRCRDGVCAITSGRCLLGCESGYWGEFCNNTCSGKCDRECHQYSGKCLHCGKCLLGCSASTGDCFGTCEKGSFGRFCERFCIDSGECYSGCNKTTGACDCPEACRECGSPNDCYSCVDPTRYGSTCQLSCPTNCKNGECAVRDGSCLNGCDTGHWGAQCDQTCPSGCENECDGTSGACLPCTNCLEGCSSESGECLGTCEKGTFGLYCEHFCVDSTNCYSGCDKVTGRCKCPDNCLECDLNGHCTTCIDGTRYGDNCENITNVTCPPHCKSNECSSVDRTCKDGCEPGFCGVYCDTLCISGPTNTGTPVAEQVSKDKPALSTGAIVGIVIAGVVVIVGLVVVVALVCKRRAKQYKFTIHTNHTYDMHTF